MSKTQILTPTLTPTEFSIYLSELIGTFILIFTILSTANSITTNGIRPMYIGLSLALAAAALGGISGGHFNPVVTLTQIMEPSVSGIKASTGLAYILAQVIGGIFAFYLVKAIMPTYKNVK